MTPRVVDISHHNTVKDLKATASAGIWGVIHKASQGIDVPDATYATRRKMAQDADLLWGAYHFNTGEDVSKQVSFFIDKSQPDNKTLLVLDFEDYRQSSMSIHQAVEFLYLIEETVGRKAAIYSGNRLKESIGSLNKADRDYIVSHRLWICQYGPAAKLPSGFFKWWLWQFTGDGVGPMPHSIPGIVDKGIDLNAYNGTQASLAQEWA